MQTVNLLQLTFTFFSPLDQFGDDTDFFITALDNALIDFLPGAGYVDDLIDFIGVTEVDGIGDWITIAFATAGNVIFDDEDCTDSE